MSHRPKGRKISTKLFVGNLPETVRKADLLVLFEKYGKVAECDIVKDFAFVHYVEPDDAVVAAEKVNGAELNGSNIRVELSHSTVRHKPGMGGKTECYRCGKEGHWSRDCPKGGPSRGGGGGYGAAARPSPYARESYDPYPPRERLPLPPAMERYARIARMRRMPHRNPYFEDPDPYARPSPEYYSRSRAAATTTERDPYLDLYSRASLSRPPP